MAETIATVNITLQTATVSRAGFGTPVFISSHRAFPERIRSYGSLSDVAEDFQTTDAAYIAASQFFAHDVSPSVIKIGRREAVGTYAPSNVDNGSVHAITVTVNDGDAVVAAYTATAGNTAEDVATVLAAAINGDAEVSAHVTAGVSGTGADAVLTITLDGVGDVYSVSGLTNIVGTYTSTESAADVMTAIEEQDGGFYFVTADDHTEEFVLAMATVVQAQKRLYFVSSQELTSITSAYSIASTDILAKLIQNNYTRTIGMWDEEADTKFVECNYVAVNAPFSPDESSVVWDGRILPGLSVAKNAAGYEITNTQKANLVARNASYVATSNAGQVRVFGGKAASGVWIDEMRTRDCMEARVQEGMEALILNQAGTKLPGGTVGKSLVESTLAFALSKFVTSGALDSFNIDMSAATIDQSTRTLSNVKFTAVLSGAILRVVINGTLVNQE